MYTSELKGKSVLDKNAKAVGKVSDVQFSPEDGKITSIVVSLKKGVLSKDELDVPYDEITTIGDYIIIKKEFVKESKPVNIENEE